MTPLSPLRIGRTVPLSPAEAFALFIEDLGTWWPDAHTVSGRAGKRPRRIEVEPHKGGRIVETTHDGRRVDWGRIIGWEPGAHVSFTWHPDAPEDEASVVTVSFSPEGDGCRVEVEQGGVEILGPLADAVSTTWLRGWKTVLGCYASATSRARVLEPA